jgi:adenosylcobinamide-GDP ribazoletransferase
MTDKDTMKQLILALQFLTIIPINIKTPLGDEDIARSSSAFVLVGLIQGLLLVATDYISNMVFHPDLVTGIVLLVLVLSNGGFHLDGLADTFDAIAIKSSGNNEEDRKKRLEVMRNSSIGPIGVIAIVFVILLKYFSLKNISHLLSFTYYSSLVAMPAVSKWAMVVSMYYGKPAREDGLGRIFINRIGSKEIGISTLILLILLILPPIFFVQYISNRWYIFYAFLILTIYIFCRICISFLNKKFGGLTGDTLGAISELTEILFLLMVIGWSRLYI